jgi:hypothetical protein
MCSLSCPERAETASENAHGGAGGVGGCAESDSLLQRSEYMLLARDVTGTAAIAGLHLLQNRVDAFIRVGVHHSCFRFPAPNV